MISVMLFLFLWMAMLSCLCVLSIFLRLEHCVLTLETRFSHYTDVSWLPSICDFPKLFLQMCIPGCMWSPIFLFSYLCSQLVTWQRCFKISGSNNNKKLLSSLYLPIIAGAGIPAVWKGLKEGKCLHLWQSHKGSTRLIKMCNTHLKFFDVKVPHCLSALAPSICFKNVDCYLHCWDRAEEWAVLTCLHIWFSYLDQQPLASTLLVVVSVYSGGRVHDSWFWLLLVRWLTLIVFCYDILHLTCHSSLILSF